MDKRSAIKIGVLSLQGDFEEHIDCLRQLGVEPLEVRSKKELKGLNGLVLPGGESTTITRLMRDYKLTTAVIDLCRSGFPVMGTCAGMILLSKGSPEIGAPVLGAMDIEVRRNGFGRQVNSFEIDLSIPVLGKKPFHGIFIRAPFIESSGKDVEILARLPDGTAVAARQGNMLAMSFHPELTGDLRLHDYFMDIVKNSVKL